MAAVQWRMAAAARGWPPCARMAAAPLGRTRSPERCPNRVDRRALCVADGVRPVASLTMGARNPFGKVDDETLVVRPLLFRRGCIEQSTGITHNPQCVLRELLGRV